MIRALATAAAAGCLVAAGLGVTAGPAAADDVCLLSSNAYQYDGVTGGGGVNYEFTLHAGRGFHSYQIYFWDNYGRLWVEGYGAEHSGNVGWILKEHVPNCV